MSSIVKSVLSQFTDWIDVCYLIEYGLCLQHISYRCVLILVIAAFSPVGSTSNLSLSPHAGAYLDIFFYLLLLLLFSCEP